MCRRPCLEMLAIFLLSSSPLNCFAERVTDEIDPGEPGEIFATKSYEIPELIGLPALEVQNGFIDEMTELDFRFPNEEFVQSFIFPGSFRPLELRVTYDRPPAAGATLSSRGSGPGGGFGFAVDANGLRIPASSGGSGGGTSREIILSIGPDPGRPPFGIDRSAPYYGGLFQWGWSVVDENDTPLIESATLLFRDTRERFPNPAPVPHLVGTDQIPEPYTLTLLSLGAAWSIAARQRGSVIQFR